MQFFFLLLVLAIFAYDAHPHASQAPQISATSFFLGVCTPPLLCAGLYWVACRLTLAHLGSSRGLRFLRWLDRAARLYRASILAMYLANLFWWGILDQVRRWTGDLVLIDEILFITPSVALLAWAWWAYYPIDRRIRQATLIRQLDQGEPLWPIWSRGQYLLTMFRHQGAVFLLPALLILGWSQAVDRYAPDHWRWIDGDPRPIITIAGCLALLLLTPVMIRWLWDTRSIPPGDLRNRLIDLCRSHRVGVRDLLIWRTFGSIVNAAVIGVLPPLRYILLSDALLERLSNEHIEAVMAHEIAHIRRHHLFWLMTIGGSTLTGLLVAWAVALEWLAQAVGIDPASAKTVLGLPLLQILNHQDTSIILSMVAAAASWIWLFGWVSRRFERQADTFAVQHLCQHAPSADHDPEKNVIDGRPIALMIDALAKVAQLNHLPIHRPSWRHGSIAWRQAYLRTLLGKPVFNLPIDRQVHLIKFAAAALVITLLILQGAIPHRFSTLFAAG